jgi:hypothetical protein
MVTSERRRYPAVPLTVTILGYICVAVEPLFACLSLISPSLRISFRQNGYLLMKEFIASEGSPT